MLILASSLEKASQCAERQRPVQVQPFGVGDISSASLRDSSIANSSMRWEAWAALMDALPGRWTEALEGWSIEESGEAFDALPPEMPGLCGLRALRRGLMLGEVKGYAKPDHALA